MFNSGRPIFVRLGGYGRQFSQVNGVRGWWFVLGPGLALSLLGLAFLIWPVFFASLIALFLLAGGISLTVWAVRLRLVENRLRDRMRTAYGEIIQGEVRPAQSWQEPI